MKRTLKDAPARYQVEVSREKLDKIEELRILGGLRSKRELFDYAFTLLFWVVRQILQGRSIAAIDDSGGQPLVLQMPFLDNVAASARQHQVNIAGPPLDDEPQEDGKLLRVAFAK